MELLLSAHSPLGHWVWLRTRHRGSIPMPILAFQALGADSHHFASGFSLQHRSFGADPAWIHSTSTHMVAGDHSSLWDLRGTRSKGGTLPSTLVQFQSSIPLFPTISGSSRPWSHQDQHKPCGLRWFLGTVWDTSPPSTSAHGSLWIPFADGWFPCNSKPPFPYSQQLLGPPSPRVHPPLGANPHP